MLLGLAYLPADVGLSRLVVGLIDGDVILLLHAVDQFFEQLLEGTFRLHLFQSLFGLLVEELAVHQCLRDRLLQPLHRLLVAEVVEIRVRVLKPTLQQVVRQGVHDIFHRELFRQVRNVLVVFDELHLVKPAVPPASIAEQIFVLTKELFFLRALFLARGELAFLCPSDSLMRVQSFEDELRSRGLQFGWIAFLHADRLNLLEKSLDSLHAVEDLRRGSGVEHLHLAAKIEVLHYLLQVVVALEISVVAAGYCRPDNFARNRIRALDFALVLEFELAGD